MTSAPPVDVPAHVRAAYGWASATLEPIAIGLINRTFRVSVDDEPIAVLQRLHPIFAPEVNRDIDAITRHLAARGLVTPRLVRTRDDDVAVLDDEGRTWRALTFVDGRCVSEIRSPSLARAAGAMAGRFTRATLDLDHTFAFTRSGVHDTPRHLANLRERRRSELVFDGHEEARQLADAILEHASTLPSLTSLPARIVHGDLKVSNVLFAPDRDEAVCLVDLDTMAHGTIATEMGDALRSWTNPRGENHERGEVDLELFRAACEGYLGEVGALLAPEERRSLAAGLETIALELAARFCLDVFDDSYFGWDTTRYDSRRAHNLVRVRSQLSLARSARSRRDELLAILDAL